jgi:hypothetical protein
MGCARLAFVSVTAISVTAAVSTMWYKVPYSEAAADALD